MADEVKTKDIQELTPEEKAQAWADWVRSEVEAALNIYLPVAKSGHININYYPHVVETLDTGDVLDKSKADGVLLSIIFEFEKPIKL